MIGVKIRIPFAAIICNFAFIDISVHWIVIRFFQERNQFIGADTFKRFAKHAAADAPHPCTGDFLFQRQRRSVQSKRCPFAKCANCIEFRRLLIRIVRSRMRISDNVKQDISKLLFYITCRKCRHGAEQFLICTDIQSFFNRLLIFDQDVRYIQLPLRHIGVLRTWYFPVFHALNCPLVHAENQLIE